MGKKEMTVEGYSSGETYVGIDLRGFYVMDDGFDEGLDRETLLQRLEELSKVRSIRLEFSEEARSCFNGDYKRMTDTETF